MKTELSPTVVSWFAGILLLVLTVGGLGYLFYVSTKVEEVPVTKTEYPTSVLSTEFGTDGVFAKTSSLVAPGGGQVAPATPVPVGSGDIGKSDLGSLE